MDINGNKNLTISQIFKISIKIMKNNFREIIFLAILVYLPTSVLFDFIHPSNFEMPTSLTLLVLISIGLVTLIYPLGIAYVIDKKQIKKEEIKSVQVFISALNKLPVAIGASAIMLSAIIITIPLIIVPFVLGIYFSFVNQAIVIKECNPIQALFYSYKMVKGKWFKVLGNLLVFNLVSLAFIVLVQLISVFIPLNIFTSSLLSIVGGIINGFPLICRTILFYNLDKKK